MLCHSLPDFVTPAKTGGPLPLRRQKKSGTAAFAGETGK